MQIVNEHKRSIANDFRNCNLTPVDEIQVPMKEKKKKPLLDNLKTKIVMGFLNQWLARLLEAFKTKEPKLWLALFLVATVLQFGIGAVIQLVPNIPDIAVPYDLLSLDWIIAHFNLKVSDTVTDLIMWVLIAITGSKTTASLPAHLRDEKIEATKAKIKLQDNRF